MAAPTYMRSLTFSAGPHSPSAWAASVARSSSSVSSPPTNSLALHHHHAPAPAPSINTHIYTHHLQSFNSHNDRNYHQHLTMGFAAAAGYGYHDSSSRQSGMRKIPPGLGAPAPLPANAAGPGGRRRSSSIRSKAPPPFIKFDPFADEPLVTTGTGMAGSGDGAAVPLSVTSPLATTPIPTTTTTHAAAQPYTIQIPAAGPTEIQRYTPAASARRLAFPAAHQQGLSSFGNVNVRVNGGGRGSRLVGGGSVSAPVGRSPSPAFSTTPTPATTSASTSTSTSTTTQTQTQAPGPNVTKLVAGIMLNRVAVGKPMRRRVPSLGERKREYVRSCLSSVVSVEA